VATKLTATKLDNAVKAIRNVLEATDKDGVVDRPPLEEAVRALLQARVALWNSPGKR
jgi:hypothetical protein